jgi:hypothetical protein
VAQAKETCHRIWRGRFRTGEHTCVTQVGPNISIPNQEITMSIIQATDVHQGQAKKTDRKNKKNEFGFIILLACVALGLVVMAAVFTPVSVASGTSDDTVDVGP